MAETYYRTGQFAKKASVTVRTLRYYDRVGLLSPSRYTQAGYRLYTDADFLRLQQILALKYLGFSLDEIRQFLKRGPEQFKEALEIQKAMMQERKAHLETIIRAIEQAQARLGDAATDWESIVPIIEVIQMEEKKEWIRKYLDEEQLQTMHELIAASYTEEDARKLTEWGKDWSEEDQLEASRRWSELFTEVKRLADAGEDPAGAEAQALAGRWMALVGEFTRGDPGITAGLRKVWGKLYELPADRRSGWVSFNPQQQDFWNRAIEIFQESQEQVK